MSNNLNYDFEYFMKNYVAEYILKNKMKNAKSTINTTFLETKTQTKKMELWKELDIPNIRQDFRRTNKFSKRFRITPSAP